MMLYRLLLLAFPRRVRDEYGEEMVRMFDAQLRTARASGSSPMRLWLAAAVDAVVHGFAERYAGGSDRPHEAIHGRGRWRSVMESVRLDLRYAVRLFLAQPGPTLVAILTLALGIGANTAIFSAVDSILLRPLPYDDPDRLVMVWEKRQTEGVFDNVVAPADYLDWEKMNTAFESIAGVLTLTADLTGSGEPERLAAAGVSPALFDLLRVKPAEGRFFRPDEVIPGRNRVVVLTHGLWLRRFGGERSIVGKPVLLNGVPHEVVGVLPATFEFPDSTIEVWAPLALAGGTNPPSRTSHQLTVYARLKPGVTLEQARTDMDRVGAILSAEYPDSNRTHGAWVTMLDEQLREPVRATLLLLLASVAFVLLIACVNVANLLLARAASRKREVAVRAALGAGRARLAGQSLTESVLLGLLGGTAGLVVAYWGIQLLRQLAPPDVAVVGLERMGLNLRILLFSAVLSIGTGLLFGMLPAWQLAHQDVNQALKFGTRTAGGVRHRLRMALVMSEIALASLLLAGAGVTWRSFHTLLNTEPGFTTDAVLTSLITLPSARYRTPEKRLATFNDIEQKLKSIPGVITAGATNALPLSGMDGRRGVGIEGREPTPDTPTRAHPRSVTPDYFRTMDIQIIAGRAFTDADRAGSPLVVIVNDTMARRYWPGQSAIGGRITFDDQQWREVVGVIRDVRHWGLDHAVNPEMYLPLAQMPWSTLAFALRTRVAPESLAGAVREQLKAVDPDLPLSNVRTMQEVAANSVAARSVSMRVLAVFGVLALVLAAAGIYGVMAHLVALRRNEIGVRMTLGAKPADIMRLILREGIIQAIAGLTIGLIGAVLVMRSFRALLYEISPADPMTLAVVGVVLLTTALLACALPARRAMKVDPVSALRL
jgi:putative ABC transport system permease protein